jgi:hypothetical protein
MKIHETSILPDISREVDKGNALQVGIEAEDMMNRLLFGWPIQSGKKFKDYIWPPKSAYRNVWPTVMTPAVKSNIQSLVTYLENNYTSILAQVSCGIGTCDLKIDGHIIAELKCSWRNQVAYQHVWQLILYATFDKKGGVDTVLVCNPIIGKLYTISLRGLDFEKVRNLVLLHDEHEAQSLSTGVWDS